MYASITKVAGSSASLRVARGKPKIPKIYRYTGNSYTCLFLLAVALRKDAEASYSRYLLHLQVVIVCCSRHRLSVVSFAGNTVRIIIHVDRLSIIYSTPTCTFLNKLMVVRACTLNF